MNTALMFSTGTDDWQTPPEIYEPLHAEFQFGWDAAASSLNTKVAGRFFHVGYSAFDSIWTPNAGAYWLNPPYSRGLQARFVAKAAESAQRHGATVVALLPARTDTKAFHDHVWDTRQHRPRPWVKEVRFLKGRVRFVGAPASAPFPSMIVVFQA